VLHSVRDRTQVEQKSRGVRHFKRHSSEASEGQVKINREAAVSNMRKSDAFDDPLGSFAMADVVRTQKDYDQLAKSKHNTTKQT
jgi:hypothetical protein